MNPKTQQHRCSLRIPACLCMAAFLVSLISGAAYGLTAAAVTGTTVTLQWTAPSDGCDGKATQYDIRYSTAPITTATWSSAVRIIVATPRNAGETETLVVSGLQSGVAYYFAGKAADASGNWAALSACVMRRTSDIIPPVKVTDLQ